VQAAPFNNRSQCWLSLDEPERAAADATAVLRLDSHNVKALFRRGKARCLLHAYAEAIQDYEWVLKLDPGNVAAKQEMKAVRQALVASGAGKTPLATRQAPSSSLAATEVPKRRLIIEEVEEESDSEGETPAPQAARANLIEEIATDRTATLFVGDSTSGTDGEVTLGDLSAKRAALEQERSTVAANVAELTASSVEMEATVSASQQRLNAKQQELDRAGAIMRKAQDALQLEEQAPPARAAEAAHDETATATATNMTATSAGKLPDPGEDDFVVIQREEAAFSAAATLSPDTSQLLLPPASPFEFMREVKARMRDATGLAMLIQSVPPAALRRLFSNQLEADHLTAVACAVARSLSPPTALRYLQALTTVDRFDMAVMFLPAKELAAVVTLIKELAADDACDKGVLQSVLAKFS